MRIIAGSAKGIILKKPATVTRPTMDRVRAAVFSMLGERVPGATVLDLFAGTGAMGIEALSRGAASALFVDHASQCREVIENNLKVTRLQGKIVKRDVLTWLAQVTNETGVLAESAESVQRQGASAHRPTVYRDVLEDASTEATPPFASAVGLYKKSTFDLIFADPPYPDKEGNNLASSLLASPHLLSLIAPEGLLILECKRHQELPEVLGLDVLIDRVYGTTRIVIFRAG